MSPSDLGTVEKLIDVASEATQTANDGTSTADISILVILLRMLVYEVNFWRSKFDQKAVETWCSCLDVYLTKHAAVKRSLGESTVFSEVLPKFPHLAADLVTYLSTPYLTSNAYEKIYSVLEKISRACPESVTVAILERIHVDAGKCADDVVANGAAVVANAEPHDSCISLEESEKMAQARSTVKEQVPLLLRLTECFVQVLRFHSRTEDGADNPLDTRIRDELVRYHHQLRPFWAMLNTHAVLTRNRPIDFTRTSHAATLTEGITAYLTLGTNLFPFLEGEITKNRRESGSFVLPTPSILRAPSPALGRHGARSSSLQRSSSHALEALSNAGGANAQTAVILSDLWVFVEAHKELLNGLLKANPQLLSGSMRILLHNPRLLDFSVKRAEVRSRIKKLRERSVNRPENRQLHIRRDRILEDSFRQLSNRSVDEIRGKLSIVFVGEEGLDGGGLIKEWFSILAREVFNPNIALFELSHDKGCYQPNPNSVVHPEYLSYFRFVGRLVGKALVDDILLNAYFTRPIYKHLLGQALTYEDMEGVDPDYYKSLKWMLENSIDGVMEYTFSETTSYFGETQVYDLVENGRHITVTDENKFEYVNLVTAYRMTNAVKHQLAAFVKGFEEVVPRETISLFNAAELELMISGTPDIDVEDLYANTEYTGFNVGSRQIRWFWDIVREMSKEDLARLLMFCTGTSKVPLEGFSALQGMQGPQKFQIHRQHADDSKLPSAHTCFNQLDLHEYSSKEILRERLLYAIVEGCEGFGFI